MFEEFGVETVDKIVTLEGRNVIHRTLVNLPPNFLVGITLLLHIVDGLLNKRHHRFFRKIARQLHQFLSEPLVERKY